MNSKDAEVFEQDQQKSVEAALAADREAALRDVFATGAMAGLITAHGNRNVPEIARVAYCYADAMLAARKC